MKIHSYTSNSGKDLIDEYISSLSRDEQIDAYSVLEAMEDGQFDSLKIKRWEGRI